MKKRSVKSTVSDRKIAESIAKDFQKHLQGIGLHNYQIKFLMKGDKGFEEKDEDCVLSIIVNYPYRDITLCVCPKAIEWKREKKHEQLKVTILHEIAHVVHWRYASLAEGR